jgi:hypothetical protein
MKYTQGPGPQARLGLDFETLVPGPAIYLQKINLLSQSRGADQAAYAHTVKAPAHSLSLGGGPSLIYSPKC